MSSVQRLAGVAGTFSYTLSAVPAEPPVMTIYSNAERTVVAVAAAELVPTANPAVFTASYPADLAAGTYFLQFETVFTVGQPALVDADESLVLTAVSGSVSGLLPSFATAEELQSLLELDSINTERAELLLSLASGAIRAEVDQVLSLVLDDTATLRGGTVGILVLPELPVLAVSAVTIDGELATDWSVNRAGVLDRFPYSWGIPAAEVSVTYDHGYETIPAEIKGVCLEAAARAYTNPEAVRTVSVGGWSSAYETGGISLTEEQKRTLDRFRP